MNSLEGVFDSPEQKKSIAEHSRQFGRTVEIVSQFVAAQLEAEPRLIEAQMQEQLKKALGLGDVNDERRAYAFRSYYSRDPNRAVWVIAYSDYAWAGWGGSRTVVESYVVENGKARRTGRSGSEFDGYVLSAQRISAPGALSVSLMVYGIHDWNSGHVLRASAILYSATASDLKTVWRKGFAGLYSLMPLGTGFVIEYHDEDRHGKNLPATSVEMYSTATGVPRRLTQAFME